MTPRSTQRYTTTRAHNIRLPCLHTIGALHIYLRREIAVRFGHPQKATHTVLRVSFAKLADYQKRSPVHFHTVIRFDGSEDSSEPPPPPRYATAEVLTVL
ncbi:replication initiator [Kitasatospora sp. NPDC058478]|uniref:replication initiator n=1 Tax=unclassified Kitasatospora TaxID=2633591 RepID=UPI0036463D7D